jgi:hypothetical protein
MESLTVEEVVDPVEGPTSTRCLPSSTPRAMAHASKTETPPTTSTSTNPMPMARLIRRPTPAPVPMSARPGRPSGCSLAGSGPGQGLDDWPARGFA